MEKEIEYPLAKTYAVGEEGEVVRLCSNESPLGPPPQAMEAIKREIGKVGYYPDPKAKELKLAIGRYLGVGPDQIAVGNGSDEITDLICKAFLDPGDKALIPIPTFSQYELACAVNDIEPNFVKLQNFEWRVEDLMEGFKEAKVAFICRPNNPTGNSISKEDLKELLDVGKLVVVDEAYAEIAGYSIIDLVGKYDNLLVMRTFSKAFGLAGLRIGYAVGRKELVRALERVRAPFSVNTLAQVAAIATLSDGSFLQRVRNVVREGREYLTEKLAELGLRVLPSDANFIMVDVTPLGMDASTLCGYLAERGILIRDLSDFRGAGPSWVRISVGTPSQNKRLIEAVKNLKGGG